MSENKRFTFEKEKIIYNTACRIFDKDKILFEVNFDSLRDMNSKEVEDLCIFLNEQDQEITQLKKENQTIYCQLNNFKLCKWDLEEENKLLKQALCETLQDTGNGYLIKIMDKLFQLEYTKWESEQYYEDWEETLELKELRDLYER